MFLLQSFEQLKKHLNPSLCRSMEETYCLRLVTGQLATRQPHVLKLNFEIHLHQVLYYFVRIKVSSCFVCSMLLHWPLLPTSKAIASRAFAAEDGSNAIPNAHNSRILWQFCNIAKSGMVFFARSSFDQLHWRLRAVATTNAFGRLQQYDKGWLPNATTTHVDGQLHLLLLVGSTVDLVCGLIHSNSFSPSVVTRP